MVPVVENHCCITDQAEWRFDICQYVIRSLWRSRCVWSLQSFSTLHPINAVCVTLSLDCPVFHLKGWVWFGVNLNLSLVIQLIQFILIATARWIIHVFVSGWIDEWVWGWQKNLMHRVWLSYGTIQTAHRSTLTHMHKWQGGIVPSKNWGVFFFGWVGCGEVVKIDGARQFIPVALSFHYLTFLVLFIHKAPRPVRTLSKIKKKCGHRLGV